MKLHDSTPDGAQEPPQESPGAAATAESTSKGRWKYIRPHVY